MHFLVTDNLPSVRGSAYLIYQSLLTCAQIYRDRKHMFRNRKVINYAWKTLDKELHYIETVAIGVYVYNKKPYLMEYTLNLCFSPQMLILRSITDLSSHVYGCHSNLFAVLTGVPKIYQNIGNWVDIYTNCSQIVIKKFDKFLIRAFLRDANLRKYICGHSRILVDRCVVNNAYDMWYKFVSYVSPEKMESMIRFTMHTAARLGNTNFMQLAIHIASKQPGYIDMFNSALQTAVMHNKLRTTKYLLQLRPVDQFIKMIIVTQAQIMGYRKMVILLKRYVEPDEFLYYSNIAARYSHNPLTYNIQFLSGCEI